MAANIDGEGFHAARCQRVSQRVNAGARPGGTVHQNGYSPDRRATGRIVAIGNSSSIAGLKSLDVRHRAAIDRARGIGDRRQRRGPRERCCDSNSATAPMLLRTSPAAIKDPRISNSGMSVSPIRLVSNSI
jgi:hypothetical protein